jgi:hypothetical protein
MIFWCPDVEGAKAEESYISIFTLLADDLDLETTPAATILTQAFREPHD